MIDTEGFVRSIEKFRSACAVSATILTPHAFDASTPHHVGTWIVVERLDPQETVPRFCHDPLAPSRVARRQVAALSVLY